MVLIWLELPGKYQLCKLVTNCGESFAQFVDLWVLVFVVPELALIAAVVGKTI
jgi:hypothetical protein